MSRTSSWEGTQEQLVMLCEEISLARACVSFSIPGAAKTTLPPQANALNSSCGDESFHQHSRSNGTFIVMSTCKRLRIFLHSRRCQHYSASACKSNEQLLRGHDVSNLAAKYDVQCLLQIRLSMRPSKSSCSF